MDTTDGDDSSASLKRALQKVAEKAKISKLENNKQFQHATKHSGHLINGMMHKFFRKTIPNKCPYCGHQIGKIRILQGYKFYHCNKIYSKNEEGNLDSDDD